MIRNHAVHPGQDIEYVVVNYEKTLRDRVVLAHESIETYDSFYYEMQLVRAIESILSPLGWDQTGLKRELTGKRQSGLVEYNSAPNE